MAKRSPPKDEQQEKGDIKPHNEVQDVSKDSRTKYDISEIGPHHTSDLGQKKKKSSSAIGKKPAKKFSKGNLGTVKNEEVMHAKAHQHSNKSENRTNKTRSLTKKSDLKTISNKEDAKHNYKQRLQALSYGFQMLSVRHPSEEEDTYFDYNSNNHAIIHDKASLVEALDALDRAYQEQKNGKKQYSSDNVVIKQTDYYNSSSLSIRRREDMRRMHAAFIKRVTGKSPDLQGSYHHDYYNRQMPKMHIETERKTKIASHLTKTPHLEPAIITKHPSRKKTHIYSS